MEDLDTVVDLLGGGGLDVLDEHRAGIITPEALGVGAIHDREPEAGVDPAVGVERPLGVHGEAGAMANPRASLTSRMRSRRGPRPLGVHVVGGDGGDAAPVVDARVEQHAEVVGQVRWGLQVHLGREDEAGERDGLEVLVGRARRGAVHAVPGFGRKFWTITSCTCP